MSPERLATRVVAWQVLFTCATAVVLYFVPPSLLLLPRRIGDSAALSLTTAVLIAGSLSAAHGWGVVFTRRSLLSQVRRRSRSVDQMALPKLNDDPWRVANGWVLAAVGAIALSMTGFRPAYIPPQSAFTLGLFASVLVAAASLPLLMAVRSDYVRLMERVPPDIMAEIIDAQVKTGLLRGRSSRRLLAAIVTPVAFLAIGSFLIALSHLNAHADRELVATARSLVRSSLVFPADSPASQRAQAVLADGGFRTEMRAEPSAAVDLLEHTHGVLVLSSPVPSGTVVTEFSASSNHGAVGVAAIIALVVLGAAGWVGFGLARLLSRDLRMANRGVRMLGTDAALEGTRVMRPARFRAVAELGSAIELLATRFRMFANAQERSILARGAATRARGRFFASVSHDLKSPLNAILGFAELCAREPATNAAQRESLELIMGRAKELLALIETILDAARAEAGQLQLSFAEERLESVLDAAISKARELVGITETLVSLDVPDGVPDVVVDRVRFSQALATFIGHALRTAERSAVRLLVEQEQPDPALPLKKRRVTVYVEVPSAQFSALELERMLRPEEHPGQHRGLSLAMRLAKSVIELHGGSVNVTGRTVREPAFAIELRGRAGL